MTDFEMFLPLGWASSWLTLFSGLWNMSSNIFTGVTLLRSKFCAWNKFEINTKFQDTLSAQNKY